jgi:ketosteroid isomerase-like protein
MSRLKTARPLAAAGVLAWTLVGCAGGGGEAPVPEEPQIDLAAEEQAVRQINVKWLGLHRAKDADGIGALFVEDGWTLSGTEGLSDGRPGIVATANRGFEKNPDAVSDWGSKQVWVAASGDFAVERGWWTGDDDGEGDAKEVKGEYITIFTKVNGEWKVLADAGAPVEGMAAEE